MIGLDLCPLTSFDLVMFDVERELNFFRAEKKEEDFILSDSISEETLGGLNIFNLLSSRDSTLLQCGSVLLLLGYFSIVDTE